LDPTNDDRLVIPRWLKIGAGVFGLFVAAAMAFAIFEPIQVLPRLRLAPGYALTAEDGSMVTSEDGRGVITLYTFSRTDCGEACEEIDTIMTDVGDRVEAEVDLGEVDFRLITVALDPLSSDRDRAVDDLSTAAAAAGADGTTWRWVGGSEADLRNVVGAGFRRPFESTSSTDFDPGFILVDGLGVVRGDYRYETLGDTADKLTRHVGILGDELKYANGAAGVAYEAAHLFLCYP
jgi:protein SCO1/2